VNILIATHCIVIEVRIRSIYTKYINFSVQNIY